MYDDDVQTPMSVAASDRYYKVAKFPTRNIKTPFVLVYGGSDSLIDIEVMLKQLPRHTVAKKISHFEHLDFLWAQEVEQLVFPIVFETLTMYAGRDHLKSVDPHPRSLGNGQVASRANPKIYNDDICSHIYFTPNDTTDNAEKDGSNLPAYGPPPFISCEEACLNKHSSPPIESSTTSCGNAAEHPNHLGPHMRTCFKHTRRRNGSASSLRSFDNAAKFGYDGISVGVGRATTGVVKANLPSAYARKLSGAKRRKGF